MELYHISTKMLASQHYGKNSIGVFIFKDKCGRLL